MPVKILVVDDQPDNLKHLVSLIAANNPEFELLRTTNPVQALEICRKEIPSIVITDWEMPEMSGLQLIERIKADPTTQHVEIIMCTGIMTSSENLNAALNTGAIDYVRKPVDPIELEARLNTVIRLCNSQQELRMQLKIVQEQKEEIARQKESREQFLVHELTLKEQDVSELAMMLSHKQNMASTLVEKLKQLRRQRDVLDPTLNELLVSLNIQMQDQELEQVMHERIDEVNAAFYERLTAKFPDLSKGERELCALIRAGISTKQIAEVKHISPESVGKKRQRLRKRMQLDSSVDLDEMLKAL